MNENYYMECKRFQGGIEKGFKENILTRSRHTLFTRNKSQVKQLSAEDYEIPGY